MKRCWFLHSWSKWTQYEQTLTCVIKWGKAAGKQYDAMEKRQKRTCNLCGKAQDRLVES